MNGANGSGSGDPPSEKDRREVSFLAPAELLRRHGLQAKKSWGQCFLHDPRIVTAIAKASGVTAEDTVIEIGAGLGVLTAALAARAARVIAIERDRDLVSVLREEFAADPRVVVEEQNALTYDFDRGSGPPVVVVGNLPYNISSPLLFRLLEQRRGIRTATLMLQRELAQRIVAPPGSRTYGVPSVLCQHLAEVRICLQVGRGAFIPAPRVDSSVIQLRMRADVVTPPLFEQTVRAAFAQRRKTLARALAARFESAHVRQALQRAGLDPRARAETLAVSDFVKLAQALGEQDEKE